MSRIGENLNALLFAAGFVSLVAGLSSYSGALAAVVAGLTLMSIAAWPYVQRRPTPPAVTEVRRG